MPSKLFRDLCDFHTRMLQEIHNSSEVLIEDSCSPVVERIRDSIFSGVHTDSKVTNQNRYKQKQHGVNDF